MTQTQTYATRPCSQEIDTIVDGVIVGTTLCGRTCEYVHSKKLRDVGAGTRQYPYCSGHRSLRKKYGKKDPRIRREIQHKEETHA